MCATFGREPGPCISLGANREQNRKIGEASYIAFLCFESRIPLSGRFGHVFCQACRCGRLGASATLSFHPVLIVFLCFEIRIPLSSRCGHVFCQACRCGRLGASATLSFHPVLIVFLCFEIRSPLSSRCGHVFQPSLSLWTAWRACYFEFPSCSYCVSVF